MATSDNSSPPPVEPVDQLAELRRKRGAKPERVPARRSSRRPTTGSDRNRFAGADALNGAGPLGAGLGAYLDGDDVDDALDAITAEQSRRRPAHPRRSFPTRPRRPTSTPSWMPPSHKRTTRFATVCATTTSASELTPQPTPLRTDRPT